MPSKRSQQVPVRYPVTVEFDGKEYQGTYSVSRGMLTVASAYGSTTAHIGGLAPEDLARTLLDEQVRKSR